MNLKMLQAQHLSILEVETVEEFRRQIIRFAKKLEFETVNAITVLDHSTTHSEFHVVDNTPDAFQSIAHDQSLSRRDPVMQHCKHSSVPIIWDRDTYSSHGQTDLWEQQAPYGFKAGVAVALHLPGNQHFFVGVDRDKSLTYAPRTLTRLVADLQLFVVHAQISASRLFIPQPSTSSDYTALTPREIEALRWTMDGKSASEVGDILNISTRTAVFHLQNATRKLGCKSKFHAVLTAIKAGLIT